MWIYLANLIAALLITGYLRKTLPWLEANGMLSIGVFFLVYMLLWLLSFFYHRRWFKQQPRILILVVNFIKEVIVANIKVTYEVLSIEDKMTPAVIAVPLDVQEDGEIMLLANMITLTPGTLSIDVSDDRKTLYVHTLYTGPDVDAFRRGIKEGFERKILAITSLRS